jgi:transposase
MGEIATIGLDLAKNVFQVHGIDAQGKVLVRRQLRRTEVLEFFAKARPCLVGMEACATAHHWAEMLRGSASVAGGMASEGREIAKQGHEVRLIPPTSSRM